MEVLQRFLFLFMYIYGSDEAPLLSPLTSHPPFSRHAWSKLLHHNARYGDHLILAARDRDAATSHVDFLAHCFCLLVSRGGVQGDVCHDCWWREGEVDVRLGSSWLGRPFWWLFELRVWGVRNYFGLVAGCCIVWRNFWSWLNEDDDGEDKLWRDFIVEKMEGEKVRCRTGVGIMLPLFRCLWDGGMSFTHYRMRNWYFSSTVYSFYMNILAPHHSQPVSPPRLLLMKLADFGGWWMVTSPSNTFPGVRSNHLYMPCNLLLEGVEPQLRYWRHFHFVEWAVETKQLIGARRVGRQSSRWKRILCREGVVGWGCWLKIWFGFWLGGSWWMVVWVLSWVLRVEQGLYW